jgi:hypothetical protein
VWGQCRENTTSQHHSVQCVTRCDIKVTK